jgi:hypothetical protein
MTAEECLWHLSRETELLAACPPRTTEERLELRNIIERLQDVLVEELEDVAA